ncbi:hypothetical protein GIW26_12530 [Pseudomonas syringae]|uniref:hypothetical protein n=1 Tax=Pseudomonas TaxID=286 RepID=UPI0039786573|nr:hypothetical protein [Pseudomonas syringae]MCF9001622.1 hypothetical protein [Pseudomonas syringae]
MKSEAFTYIKDAIHDWLYIDLSLDSASASGATSQITYETQFSDLAKKYEKPDQVELAAVALLKMRLRGLEMPEKLKDLYNIKEWQSPDGGLFGNPNDIHGVLETEIKNTKTVGELADLLK